jgi:hypothetical protein
VNATIGLLAYGLQPSPLTDEAPTWLLASGAYGSYSWELQMAAAHAGCHISAFCRNPLHPGPCKGWKHHLGLVSPGALHALEKVRHEKLEQKRQAKVKALQDAGHAVPKSLLKPIVYDPAKNKYLQQPDKITPGLGIPTKGLTPEAAKATLEKIPTKAQVGEKLDAKHAAEAAAQPKTPLEAWEAGGEHRDALTKQELLNLAHQVGPYSAKSKEIHKYIQDNKKKLDKQAADHLAGLAVQAKADNAAKQAKLAKVNEDKGPLSDVEKAMFAKVGGGGISKSETGGWVHEPSGDPVSKDEAAALDSLAERGALQVIGGNVLPSGLGKHLAAGGAVPHQAPQYLTISKAGLKEGDQVFLHGKGKTAGEGQLVTVHKLGGAGGGKAVGGGKAQGYEFKDAQGNNVGPAGGVSSKWHLSPAPGKSFPDTPAQKVAKNIATAQEHGDMPVPHKTTAGQVSDVLAAKHKAQGEALGKFFHQVIGVPHDPQSQKKYEELAAKKAEAGEPLAEANKIEAGAKKIAAKIYPIGGNAALMHQSDLEQALIKDIHGGVNEGKPTPVLDAAREAGVSLGQGKPGAAQALADAVHAKLGISGHDDTPAKPEPAAPFEDISHVAQSGPNVGAAPHVKEAIDYAHGFKAGTDTKKLAAYQKLTLDEINKLDPNTKQLMAANLAGMHKKFLNSKKKETVQELLNDVQKAQGGGAGAGGSSAVHTPTAAEAMLEQNKKIAAATDLGTAAAYGHGVITEGPGTPGYEGVKQVFEGIHQNPDPAYIEKAFHDLGEAHAQHLLTKAGIPHETGMGAAVLPHVTAELASALKGEGKPTPLTDALHNSTPSDQGPFVDAALKHLSPEALGVKQATSFKPADVAHSLVQHASGKSDSSVASEAFVKMHNNLTAQVGQEKHHTELAKAYASAKTANVLKSLNLGGEEQPKLQAKIHDVLAPKLTSDYKDALDTNNPHPGGLASEIDKIAADTNAKGAALAQHNGWPEDSPAIKTWKSNYFANKVKDVANATPQAGAGGTSTHVSPAVHVSPAATVSDLGAVSVPDVPELPEGETHALGGGDGIGHLSEATKGKIGDTFHSLPFGTSTSDPIESVFDNLVAVAGWHGQDAGPLSVLQAAQIVDEAKAKKYGSVNKNLTEKALLSWLGTKNGKEYAEAYSTPKADQITYLKDPEAAKKAALSAQQIKLEQGQKVQTLAGGPGAFDPNLPSHAFESFDHDQAQKSQDDYMAKTGEKWTGAQKQAITTYTGSSYQEINDYLRGKGEDPSGKYQKYATQIQAGMRPLAHNQLLLRGSSYKIFPDGFKNIEGVKKLIGEEISDVGFVSTSIAGAGGEFTKAIKLHIEAPAGTMGAYVRSISSHPGENEMILAAGTKFRILSVDTHSGHQPIVRLRVVS